MAEYFMVTAQLRLTVKKPRGGEARVVAAQVWDGTGQGFTDSGQQVGEISGEEEPEQEDVMSGALCPTCGRVFSSARGLSQHERVCNPELHDSLVYEPEQVRRQWPEAAVYAVARLQVENPLWASSILDREASHLLAQLFSMDKSPKTVSSYRRTPRYREVLRSERLIWYDPVAEATMVKGADSARGRMRSCLRHLAKSGKSSMDRRLDRIIWDTLKGRQRDSELNKILQSLGTGRYKDEDGSGKRSPRKRRGEYLVAQESFKRNRTETARNILDNTVAGSSDPSAVKGFKQFWTNSFALQRESDCSNMIPVPLTNYNRVWEPIFVDDLPMAFRNTKGTAAGPDGLTVKEFKGLGTGAILKILNLILVLGKVPECLKRSRTTFIPKVDKPTLVKHFRPVSVTSIILRSLHKILAKRLMSSFWLDERQRGFLPCDGIAENIVVLDGLLSDARKRRRPVVVTLLDFANAFSSVNHDAIVSAMNSSSMPEGLVDYIKDLYGNFVTTLELGRDAQRVRVERGILQGDPLSPFLFNLVIDQALRLLPRGTGYRLRNQAREELECSGLAFADDTCAIGENAPSAQLQLSSLRENTGNWGLDLNPTKCDVLALIKENRNSRLRVAKDVKLSVGLETLKCLGPLDEFKYLGAVFDWKGLTGACLGLEEMLSRVRTASLKPCQKFYVLRTHLLPRLVHKLTFQPFSSGRLCKVDRLIREALLSILKLPLKTPLSFFYAARADGGLGITRLRHMIPLSIYRRFGRLAYSKSPIIAALAEKQKNKDRVGRALRLLPLVQYTDPKQPQNIMMKPATSSKSCKQYHREKLLGLMAGRGLERASCTPSAHSWISDGAITMRGRQYLDALKLRAGLLPTRACKTTQYQGPDRLCRLGCSKLETNFHVLQVCTHVEGLRTTRHNRIVTTLEEYLIKKGAFVVREPVIRCKQTFCKPDLIIYGKGGNVGTVLDVQVTGQQGDLNEIHESKRSSYNQIHEVEQYVKHMVPVGKVCFTTLTMHFKGTFCPRSVKSLRKLGISNSLLRKLAISVSKDGSDIYRAFLREDKKRNGKP